MPGIGDYVALVKLVLAESGKYFSLLLLSVLAIRLWRNGFRSSGAGRLKNLLLAAGVSALACGVGCFSIRNSMGVLYSHYAVEAFNAGRLEQAYSLFETSSKFWPGADATGGQGVCLLLSGKADAGEALLRRAGAMRKGKNSTFEQFYEGLYCFLRGEPDKALPLLEAASADLRYHWTVVKLLAVMELDRNHPDAAAELMKPFVGAAVTESDQAYVIASLDLAAGKKAGAKALLDKFSTTNLPPSWKSRFDRLQAQINRR